jgi:hypothetical protein
MLRALRPAEEVVEPDGLLSQLTERLMAPVTQIEVTADLGYESGTGGTRNGGTIVRTLVTESYKSEADRGRLRRRELERRRSPRDSKVSAIVVWPPSSSRMKPRTTP